MILSGDFEEQMQSSHSPSVALRLCCAPEGQCLLQGNFTHVWCLICMAGAPVFAASNQETSLNCLALVSQNVAGLHSYVSWECGNQKDGFGKDTTKRALHRLWTEAHSPVFL